MSRPAIEVRGLGKRYFKGSPQASLQKKPFWQPFAAPLAWVKGRRAMAKDDGHFWALKDLDLTIEHGEALGVIGGNGAGKSTLLKILARITAPTEGRAVIRGRVASLLEVGTGFQKSLSGRENIYLNAAIMGMSREQTRKRFDEIVDFSGVGEFIDMPVKHYSSGMYSRLAFAVAAHVDADILLVDEVLSVGDLSFREKSLGKMNQLMGSGRTVVFVSHAMDAVVQFCHKAVWLDRGRLIMAADAKTVTRQYCEASSRLRANWGPAAAPARPAAAPAAPVIDTRGAELLAVEIVDAEGRGRTLFSRSEPIEVRLRYRILDGKLPILPAFHLISSPRHHQAADVHVFTSFDAKASQPRPAGEYAATAVIPARLLHSGEYRFGFSLVTPGGKLIRHAEVEDALTCRILDDDPYERVFGTPIRGVIRPVLEWSSTAVEPGVPA